MEKLEAVYKKWEAGGPGKPSQSSSGDNRLSHDTNDSDGKRWGGLGGCGGGMRFGSDRRRRRSSGGKTFAALTTLVSTHNFSCIKITLSIQTCVNHIR